MSPLCGKLFQLFPLKLTLIAFIAIFMVGSLVAGLAHTSPALIAARAVTGVGGSGILTGAVTCIAAAVPIQKRALLNGIIMGCFGLGQAVGPLVGGALTSYVTWRWCFFL